MSAPDWANGERYANTFRQIEATVLIASEGRPFDAEALVAKMVAAFKSDHMNAIKAKRTWARDGARVRRLTRQLEDALAAKLQWEQIHEKSFNEKLEEDS